MSLTYKVIDEFSLKFHNKSIPVSAFTYVLTLLISRWEPRQLAHSTGKRTSWRLHGAVWPQGILFQTNNIPKPWAHFTVFPVPCTLATCSVLLPHQPKVLLTAILLDCYEGVPSQSSHWWRMDTAIPQALSAGKCWIHWHLWTQSFAVLGPMHSVG